MCHISRGLLACNGMKNEVVGGLKRYFIDKASFAINKRVIKMDLLVVILVILLHNIALSLTRWANKWGGKNNCKTHPASSLIQGVRGCEQK